MQRQDRRGKKPARKQQPRKDSKAKRVNFDNTREDKFERDEMRERSGWKDNRSNDVSWYARNAELLRSAASIPFSTTIGMPLDFDRTTSVPGVMTLQWCPIVGGAYNAPLNQAARSLYSYLVHANSRNYSYNDPDLMIMIMAGANVFSAYALGVRAYGTMRRFSQLDYYTPEALVTAQGFNYEDLKKNLSRMWFDLNELSARLTQIWVPNTLPVFNRWFWLNSNIYKDGDSAKSQYYQFVQSQFYQYIAPASGGAGKLQPYIWVSGASKSNTWDEYMNMMNSLLDTLLSSEDRGIIFGDILNAYGADKIFAVNAISSDYMVEPVYDKEVLTQIENATVTRWRPANVEQDTVTNTLVQRWNTGATLDNGYFAPSVQVLNFHQIEPPTPEQIMVATRLKVAGCYTVNYTGGSTTVLELSPDAYGTEIIVGVTVVNYNWTGGTKSMNYLLVTTDLLKPQSDTINTLSVYRWSAFDWAPWIYMTGTVTQPTSADQHIEIKATRALGDWDNYTFISVAELNKMHTTAI